MVSVTMGRYDLRIPLPASLKVLDQYSDSTLSIISRTFMGKRKGDDSYGIQPERAELLGNKLYLTATSDNRIANRNR